MICPHCHDDHKSKVLETRLQGDYIARRRMCSACQCQFTTREAVATDVCMAGDRTHKFQARKTPVRDVQPSVKLETVWRI